VIAGALLIPRVLLRLATKVPPHLPLHSPFGSGVDRFLVNAGHTALYGALFFMPLSGFAMGYFGGKGVPFYGLFTIPGKMENRTPEDGASVCLPCTFVHYLRIYIFNCCTCALYIPIHACSHD
jgi:cytochrome b561